MPPTRARYSLLYFACVLSVITFIDRVCIASSAPVIRSELGLTTVQMGWVFSAFTFAYAAFEIPSGWLGDLIGPRKTLMRIVLWWSAFTALTGAVSRFPVLLLTRFLFGAGEAGAFPNAGVVVARWFPATQRATLSGICLMASQIGGALAPLLVVPIQMRWGWRASFFVLGLLGVFWASAWYVWFRDSPAEKLGEAQASADVPAEETNRAFPWRAALRSKSVWSLLIIGFCYVYVYNFYQTWFHTFLVKGRGVAEGLLWLSALPYVTAACGNFFGGTLSDNLVARFGQTSGRRVVGVTCLVAAAAAMLAAGATRQPILTIVLLSVAYGAIATQQSVAFGVCLDIGHRSAGAMVGLFNTVCQVGGLIGSVAYGYIVEWSGSYNAPFIPMAALLFLGAYFWWNLDASQELAPTPAGQPS